MFALGQGKQSEVLWKTQTSLKIQNVETEYIVFEQIQYSIKPEQKFKPTVDDMVINQAKEKLYFFKKTYRY